VTNAASPLTCAGCGAPQPDVTREPYPFRCVRAAELPDVDHLVTRTLDPARIDIVDTHEDNPFVRYRRFLHSYHVARNHGLSDTECVDLVTRLDDAVARVDGCGFRVTPLRRVAELEAALGLEPPGALWIKDETHNVSGSHKARHLMGVMLYLRVIETLGLDDPRRRGLAIASCGNAALAAAVIARAAGYSLRVFVPTSADREVVEHIEQLGATVEVCPRMPGTHGDPSYLRFRQALTDGALPFCCQGNENGLTIEGGETLGLELIEATGSTPPGRLVVQVGGGALASACLQAVTEMRMLGRITARPRFHAVQTAGAFPLKRAYDRVRDRMAADASDADIDVAMRDARSHRSAFMSPWEAVPHSVAHGILDDETYDWAAVVEGMLRSGGSPVVVNEDELRQANAIARATTGIDVDHTGSAGLAGLMQLLRTDFASRRDSIAVIFSGVQRSDARRT
jgi:threonine synthase